MTIQVGDETVELGAGRHAFGPRDIPHRFTVGPEGAHMLWVLTPGGFEDFVEEVKRAGRDADHPPAERPAARERRRYRPAPRQGAAAGLSRTGQAALRQGGPPADGRSPIRLRQGFGCAVPLDG